MTIVGNKPSEESTAPPRALGVVMFLICFGLFLGGFWLMAIGFDQASALLFGGGLLACGLAYLIPTQLMSHLD